MFHQEWDHLTRKEQRVIRSILKVFFAIGLGMTAVPLMHGQWISFIAHGIGSTLQLFLLRVLQETKQE